MRRIILLMIASNSLSAFSASATSALSSNRIGGPVQPARTSSPPVSAAAPPPSGSGSSTPTPAASPNAPRGSLLDLRV